MNLIERVLDEMTDDDDDTAHQSELLAAAYDAASPEAKEVVDTIFVCLCGWQLSTLLKTVLHV
jgi:hypothetical protein